MNTTSFGRKRDQRQLLLRNLVTSVILYESIITTDAKGRAIQPIVDRLIRTAQSKDALTARRALLAYILDKNAVNKIFEEILPRFTDQTSGFTRRYNLPPRLGDGAPRVVVQLTKTILLDPPQSKSDKTETPAKEVKKPAKAAKV